MNSIFEKLKRNEKVSTWIFSVGIGVACGLFSVGLALLVFKLTKINFPILYTAIIGTAIALIGFGVSFLFANRSEKKIAKGLDEKYHLAERVQTMVEYKNGEDEMLCLQRRDAEERLLQKTGGKFVWKKIIVTAVAFTLAVATFITGVAFKRVTENNATPTVPKEEYRITEWQVDSMLNLIAYVEESEMSAKMKPIATSNLTELCSLLFTLDEAGGITTLATEEETSLRVKETITAVDEAVEANATHKELYLLIYNSKHEGVKRFALALTQKDVRDCFEDIRETFANEGKNLQAVKDSVTAFVEGVETGFSVAELPQTDELLQQTLGFTKALKEIINNPDYTYVTMQSELDTAFSRAEGNINAWLSSQCKDREICDYIIAELIKIFEIKNPPPTGGDALPPIAGEEDEEDGDASGGPPNPDKPKYGSDDEIYYPVDEKYVEYGDVYKDYNAKKDEILNDTDASEDLQDLVDKYFELLGGTSSKPSN